LTPKGQEGVVNGFEPHRSSDLHMEDRQAWQGNFAAVAALQQNERLLRRLGYSSLTLAALWHRDRAPAATPPTLVDRE
jgi:hypothetical protein